MRVRELFTSNRVMTALLAGGLLLCSHAAGVRANEPARAALAPAALSLAGAFVYPVPFQPGQGHRTMTFSNLSAVAKIQIYTVSGELVRELNEIDGDGQLVWDVRNEDGALLASDAYIYFIDSGADRKVGRFVVIR